jgi:serine/threonine-protein kinase
MTEYHEDYRMLSAGPPPVMYSDHVYDYPSSEHYDSSRLSWPIIVAVIGACVAVIAVVIAATVVLTVPTRTPSPPTTVLAAPEPSVVTSVSTVTAPPPALPRDTVTVSPSPAPTRMTPVPVPIPASGCPQRLRSQAYADYSVVSSEATGLWVPQLSSKQPGLVADGVTWDCDSILAEHLRLRGLYGAKLLWSGDWPNTFGHDDYWVTVAGYFYDTSEGARQWCQDHGRDVPEHCYPTQIR